VTSFIVKLCRRDKSLLVLVIDPMDKTRQRELAGLFARLSRGGSGTNRASFQ
jgi:hypothetical protein